jgi:hypothetical protein
MKLTPVSCQNCGASIEIPDSARFVTCQFCRTQLSVQHTGSAIYTELLGDIAEKTTEMAEDLKAIRLQNEIEKLDREWEIERGTLLVRRKDGSTTEPNEAGAVIVGLIFTVMAAFMTAFVYSFQEARFMTVGPVIFVCVGIYTMIAGPRYAATFHKARASYEERRRALEGKLSAP